MQPTVAILGAGSIGTILARGLLRAGWDLDDLVLSVRRKEHAAETERLTGIRTLLDPAAAADGSRVVVIAVKPQDIDYLLGQVRGVITVNQVVVSLVAGVATRVLEAELPVTPVVRAMPQTPAAVGEAITAYCVGQYVNAEAEKNAVEVLSAVGETISLSEHLLDIATAISGTGPAYVFLLAEALTEAAIREGLPHQAAERLVEQTIRGSGILLQLSDKSATQLRHEVTSPGGTTAAAMHVLENGGFRALLEEAVCVAARRSRDLGSAAESTAD